MRIETSAKRKNRLNSRISFVGAVMVKFEEDKAAFTSEF